MNNVRLSDIPFFWVIPFWAGVGAVYFIAAECYLWKKTGVNLRKFWWKNSGDNLKTERRFADEIRKFPQWGFACQTIKWETPVVVIGYIVSVFVCASRR
jgi:hypothetical protein